MSACIFPIYMEAPDGKLKTGNIAQYNVCETGIYLTKSMAGGSITVKVDGIPGIGAGRESINILKRKIPMTVFWETVDFFRYVEEHHKEEGLEAYVIVGHKPATNAYFIWVPEQKVGMASVAYDISDFYKENPGCFIVMDIHSHTSNMGAFFSTTDDKDDNRDRFSMVLGHINKIIPEFKLRFSTMGKRQEYDLEDVFEDSDEEIAMPDYEEAVKRVQVEVIVYNFQKTKKNKKGAGATSKTFAPAEIESINYHNAWDTYYREWGESIDPDDIEDANRAKGRNISTATNKKVSQVDKIYNAIAQKLEDKSTFLVSGC